MRESWETFGQNPRTVWRPARSKVIVNQFLCFLMGNYGIVNQMCILSTGFWCIVNHKEIMYTKWGGLYSIKREQRSDQGISTTGDLRSKPAHGLALLRTHQCLRLRFEVIKTSAIKFLNPCSQFPIFRPDLRDIFSGIFQQCVIDHCLVSAPASKRGDERSDHTGAKDGQDNR